MRFAFILLWKARWPVEVQCAVLEVSRSGYYALKLPRSGGQSDYAAILESSSISKFNSNSIGLT